MSKRVISEKENSILIDEWDVLLVARSPPESTGQARTSLRITGVRASNGHQAVERHGRDAAVQRNREPAHPHLEGACPRCLSGDRRLRFEDFRATIEPKLACWPRFATNSSRCRRKLHHPSWAENSELDLSYHVRRVCVPAPGGRRDLDGVIGRIASTPLDRSRPLWEFHFAEGLADNRVAIIGKVHHALADGLASVNLLNRLMGLIEGVHNEPDPGSAGSGSTMPSRSTLLRAACRDHIRQIAELPALVGDAVRGVSRLRRRAKDRPTHPDIARIFEAPPTFLNHEVSPGRTFATTSLPLREVKETAKHLGATFNDVVLATATGALRELLLRYDGRADRPLLTTVPVSTDRSPDRISGNEISGMTVSLPVHIDDPLQRLSLVSTATTAAKEDHDLLGPTLQGRFMAYLPPPIAPALFRRQSKRAANKLMNVAVSTVPGPRVHGTIAGARVSDIYSVGILSSGSALNLTVWRFTWIGSTSPCSPTTSHSTTSTKRRTRSCTHSTNFGVPRV